MLLIRQDSSRGLQPFDFSRHSDQDSASLSDLSESNTDDSLMSAFNLQYSDQLSWDHFANYDREYFFTSQPNTGSDFSQGGSSALPFGDGRFNNATANHSYYTPFAQQLRPHRRALSNSTTNTSISTSSPRQYPVAYDIASPFVESIQYGGYPQTHHYPTPSQTPIQDTPVEKGYIRQSKAPSMAHRAMRNSASEQSQSSSSAHASQYYHGEYMGTPKTTNGDYVDASVAQSSAPLDMRQTPNLNRTMSDVYQDELYNPSAAHFTSQPHPNQQQQQSISPRSGVMNSQLQAANQAHMSTDARRQSPPFYMANHGYGPVQGNGGVRTAAAQRQLQKAQADAEAYRQHQMYQTDPNPQSTISPQEAYLDNFHDPAEGDAAENVPLFPQASSSQNHYYSGAESRPAYSALDDRRVPNSAFTFQHQAMNMMTLQQQQQQQQQQQHQPQGLQPASGYGYGTLQHQVSRDSNDSVPPQEFPARLVSMETSKSEPELDSSQESTEQAQQPQQPPNRTADSGGYTCTYSNCTMRFSTPALLQKHKREGHRSNAGHGKSAEPGSPSDRATSSASPPRDTQAGPHRCDRINPSTGKPCNTIFSRPYDLTRHEDTIHARRGKVHCEYCTEIKTFSRADALTRHMRVVHPQMEFGPKSRRNKQE